MRAAPLPGGSSRRTGRGGAPEAGNTDWAGHGVNGGQAQIVETETRSTPMTSPEVAGRRNLAVALAMAIMAIVGGCSVSAPTHPPQTSSVDSIEINGDRLSLPRTELATCAAISAKQFLFWWTASDMLVPRHPLNESYSSSLRLQFVADPPTPQSLDIQLYWHDRQLNLHWSSADIAQGGSATLESSGLNHYLLLSTLMDSEFPSLPYHVRIELHC